MAHFILHRSTMLARTTHGLQSYLRDAELVEGRLQQLKIPQGLKLVRRKIVHLKIII